MSSRKRQRTTDDAVTADNEKIKDMTFEIFDPLLLNSAIAHAKKDYNSKILAIEQETTRLNALANELYLEAIEIAKTEQFAQVILGLLRKEQSDKKPCANTLRAFPRLGSERLLEMLRDRTIAPNVTWRGDRAYYRPEILTEIMRPATEAEIRYKKLQEWKRNNESIKYVSLQFGGFSSPTIATDYFSKVKDITTPINELFPQDTPVLIQSQETKKFYELVGNKTVRVYCEQLSVVVTKMTESDALRKRLISEIVVPATAAATAAVVTAKTVDNADTVIG